MAFLSDCAGQFFFPARLNIRLPAAVVTAPRVAAPAGPNAGPRPGAAAAAGRGPTGGGEGHRHRPGRAGDGARPPAAGWDARWEGFGGGFCPRKQAHRGPQFLSKAILMVNAVQYSIFQMFISANQSNTYFQCLKKKMLQTLIKMRFDFDMRTKRKLTQTQKIFKK